MLNTTALGRDDKRIKWLCRHALLWRGFPSVRSEMTEEHWQHQRSIVDAMKDDGLFSAKTYWIDVDLSALTRVASMLLATGKRHYPRR